MDKKEIRQFKSLLKQGILRHMNISLDYKFQQELLNIINNYEQLQNNWNELKKIVEEEIKRKEEHFNFILQNYNPLKSDIKLQLEKDDLIISKLKDVLKDMQELEQGKDE